MMWEELPMASRARLMEAAVRNGYTDIRSIKAAYANFLADRLSTGNMYSDGGDTDDFEVVNLLDNMSDNVIYDTDEMELVYDNAYIPVEDYNYTGNLFNQGGTKNQKTVGGVKGLLNLFDKYHIPYRLTSGLRNGAKTASGHASYHSMTDAWGNPRAIDIAGDFEKIKLMAYSNPEIVAYMLKEGLGILEETTNDVKKKTHATGDHFHIGPDKWAIQMRDNNLKKYDATYHPMQDVTWEDVHERRRHMELTPEEETLLSSKPSTVFNPEYTDLNQESEFAKQFALNELLDRELSPMEKWLMFNTLLNPSSQGQDSFDWLASMTSVSPKITPEQKQALSNYQLFNMSGDGGQLYHGLNFAAYSSGANRFDDGGFYNTPEQKALARARNLKSPYTNYEDAVDMDDSIWLRLKKAFDKGVSNCTLTVSQLFDPNRPIGRARTIVNDSINNGFYEVDANHAVPGTMVIASNPGMSDYNPDQKYHTMVITGYAPEDYTYTFRDGTLYNIKKGEPLVSYSRGKASAGNYVQNVPLSVYNAKGEGKTFNRFYRPIDEDYPQVMLPELIVNR